MGTAGPRRLAARGGGVALGLGVGLLAGGLLGCAHAAPARCPPGSMETPARLERIRGLLGQDPEAAALVQAERPRVCFQPGRGDGVLTEDVALLDPRQGDGELAARLAHLLVHHRDGLGAGCGAGLEAALRSEAAGHGLEARLRRLFGLPALPAGTDAAADYRRRCPPRG